MHLSFHFADFFRERRDEYSEIRSRIETPTFLVQTGVVGGLKIKDPEENILNDEDARIEVALEGKNCILSHVGDVIYVVTGFMKTELDTSIDSRSEWRVVAEKKVKSSTMRSCSSCSFS